MSELNGKIEELFDDEEELNGEFRNSESFDIELGRAIAAISIHLPQRVHDASTTLFATPEGARHVRFQRSPLESTFNFTAGVSDAQTARDGALITSTAGLSHRLVEPVRASAPPPVFAEQGAQEDPAASFRQAGELDISLAVFSGDLLQFRAFMIQFKCSVDKRLTVAHFDEIGGQKF